MVVEIELLDQTVAKLDAANAVAVRVQARRPNTDTHHVRNRPENGTADTALRR